MGVVIDLLGVGLNKCRHISSVVVCFFLLVFHFMCVFEVN